MDEQKKTSVGQISAVVLLMTAVGGLVFYEPRLSSLRPLSPKPFARDVGVSEDVDVRLWQDPLAASYEHQQEVDAEDSAVEYLKLSRPHNLQTVARQIQQRAGEGQRLHLLPVMVQGGSFAEQRERRRRDRQAVISALSESGYVPTASEHIGYVRTVWNAEGRLIGGRGRSLLVPYEWFEHDRAHRHSGSEPRGSGCRPVSEIDGDTVALNEAPAAPAAAGPAQPPSVLVLWLDDTAFSSRPLHLIDQLLRGLLGFRYHNEAEPEILDTTCISMLGPATSTTLLEMLRETGEERQGTPEVVEDSTDRDDLDRRAESLAQSLLVAADWYLDDDLKTFLKSDERTAAEAPTNEDGDTADTDAEPDSDAPSERLKAELHERIRARLEEAQLTRTGLDYEKLIDSLKGSLAAILRRDVPAIDADIHWAEASVELWADHFSDQLYGRVDARRLPSVISGIDAFSSRSTASARQLLTASGRSPGHPARAGDDLREAMQRRLRSFQTTIARDDALAAALIDELQLWGLDLDDENGRHHLVLISEWDTFYGRSLPRAVGRAVCEARGDDCGDDVPARVHIRSYLRGIDGILPGAMAAPVSTGGNEGEQPARLAMLDRGTLEQPSGTSQLDSIRRLARRLSTDERALRLRRQRLAAIGVLGSDVYDKQLVLQALRPMFPQAIFFTTDLDARLFHGVDYGWSRNLIIASGYDLSLRRGLQRGIAPFRDAYQTSTFVATMYALGDDAPLGLLAAIGGVGREDLAPRMFEVARSGAYNVSAGADPRKLHPPRRSGLPDWRKLLWTSLLGGLVLILIAPLAPGLPAAYAEWTPTLKSDPRLWIPIAVALGLVALVITVAIFSALDPRGEPFELFEGISIWGTDIGRSVAILVSVIFLLLGCTRLKANTAFLADKYQLAVGLEGVESELGCNRRLRSTIDLWKRLRSVSLMRWQVDRKMAGDPKKGCDVGALWNRYAFLGTLEYRLLRVVPWTLVFLMFVYSLFLLGDPYPPARGALARNLDKAVFILAVVSASFLTFFVLDATRLCEQFIRGLGDKVTDWPKEIRDRVAGERGLDAEDAGEYLDVHLIGECTEVVGRLVVHPFVVLFLLVVSRNRYFDNWDWPWQVVLAYALITVYAWYCALALRRAAERARRRGLRRLRDRRSSLLGDKTDNAARRAAQIETLSQEIDALKRGAFAQWSKHPLIQAVLLPFGGMGTLALLDLLATVSW